MISGWHHAYLTHLDSLPFAQLEKQFKLSEYHDWPNAAGLNGLKARYAQFPGPELPGKIPEFICQSTLAASSDYYEQFIFKHQQIPTRPDNWHDLFNALVWLQFPLTKALLNQQHMEDIGLFGLHPRTLRRNKLTHFDECGVILAVEQGHEFLLEGLAMHQWHQVFVEHRALWGDKINCFMFGHANLEMLLQPFIGLTGKWLGLIVPEGFASMSLKQQHAVLDKQLAEQISRDNLFARKQVLLPLPLLGIPGCYAANQDADFYQNRDYFRAKSRPS